jgi:hypothetical protein
VKFPDAHARASGVRYIVSEDLIPSGRKLAAFASSGPADWPVAIYELPDGDRRPLPACRY